MAWCPFQMKLQVGAALPEADGDPSVGSVPLGAESQGVFIVSIVFCILKCLPRECLSVMSNLITWQLSVGSQLCKTVLSGSWPAHSAMVHQQW